MNLLFVAIAVPGEKVLRVSWKSKISFARGINQDRIDQEFYQFGLRGGLRNETVKTPGRD